MWTGYGRQWDSDAPDMFSDYPSFVFIEHSEDIDPAEVFEMYYGHRPWALGKPAWNKKHNEDLMALVGGVIKCSEDWSDCQDSFELLYTYFIKNDKGYVSDMQKLNEFFKRDDVMILSEMYVHS